MTSTPQLDDEDDHPASETISFAFDRMTVARFWETFPNARWNDALQAWTVPGVTARRRIDRWLASEANRHDPFEQESGRDAYAFEPILSPYLQVYERGFRIKTPFSRTVVDELRQVSFARWNSDDKVWEIPFASYDDLQHRWEAMDAAAKRAEPEEHESVPRPGMVPKRRRRRSGGQRSERSTGFPYRATTFLR